MLNSLTKEQLIELITCEFADVTREGGVSWSEAWALDYRESPSELAAARAKDKDKDWMEVAGDPNWHVNSISSAWTFLDSIGFQYYVIAAIVRDLIFGNEVLAADFFDGRTIIFYNSPKGSEVVANYILYKAELPTRLALMAVLDEADMTFKDYLQSGETWTPDPVWSEWLEPLEYWKQYLPGTDEKER